MKFTQTQIFTPTGVMLTDNVGNKYPEMIAVDGYHVNAIELNEEDRVALTPYMISPATPMSEIAGHKGKTTYLKFKDKAEWLSLGYEVIEEGVFV